MSTLYAGNDDATPPAKSPRWSHCGVGTTSATRVTVNRGPWTATAYPGVQINCPVAAACVSKRAPSSDFSVETRSARPAAPCHGPPRPASPTRARRSRSGHASTDLGDGRPGAGSLRPLATPPGASAPPRSAPPTTASVVDEGLASLSLVMFGRCNSLRRPRSAGHHPFSVSHSPRNGTRTARSRLDRLQHRAAESIDRPCRQVWTGPAGYPRACDPSSSW